MRIGLDGRPLCDARAGIYRFLASIVRELGRLDDTNDYYIYVETDFALPLPNPRWRKRILAQEPSRLGAAWGQLGLRSMIARDGLDVFWGTLHFFPVGIPSSVTKILTVYDMVWHRYPRTMGFRNYLMHRLFADTSVLKADKIITISESTRAELQLVLGVREDKISVVYPAPEAHYRPIEQAQAAHLISQKYGVQRDYICAVGAIEPRKNLVFLLHALSLLRSYNFACQLVVAGTPGWKNAAVYETAESLRLTEREVKFLGYVPDEDMPMLYSGARLFVFPSVYEGFGIPLVEAMACGVPIVASNASSVPEVVRDSALLVSPTQADGLADAISRVACDSRLRSSMIAKGLRRAGDFTWESSARKVLNLMTGLSIAARDAVPRIAVDSANRPPARSN